MIMFNSNFLGTVPFSDLGAKMKLGAGVAESWTVPGSVNQKYRATFAFSSNALIWVGKNIVATVPTLGVVTDTNQEELRPDFRYVSGGDVLSFISSDADEPEVGVSLLAIPG